MPAIVYKLKDGTRVSGVTTIIGQNLGWSRGALMHWAWLQGMDQKDYRDTRQAAADAGTCCHAMIEHELKDKPFNRAIYDDVTLSLADKAYGAWAEFKDQFEFKLLESEKSLVSEIWGYGGTLDIAAIKKKTAIIDLKTGNDIYQEHKIQIAAYAQLWRENYPDNPIESYYILRLGKDDGSFHHSYYASLDPEWEAFKCLLNLHNLKKKIKT